MIGLATVPVGTMTRLVVRFIVALATRFAVALMVMFAVTLLPDVLLTRIGPQASLSFSGVSDTGVADGDAVRVVVHAACIVLVAVVATAMFVVGVTASAVLDGYEPAAALVLAAVLDERELTVAVGTNVAVGVYALVDDRKECEVVVTAKRDAVVIVVTVGADDAVETRVAVADADA